MTEPVATSAVTSFLKEIAVELAGIHRGKTFALWREEAVHRVDQFLASTEPFSAFAERWVFMGDGAYSLLGGQFVDWAIDRLLNKASPDEIIALFWEEVVRNRAVYEDVSPLLGVEIPEECDLGDGVRLTPPPLNMLDIAGYRRRSPWPQLPTETGFLVQRYVVTPAFERRAADAASPTADSETLPDFATREEVRRRCRLACLLGTIGPVELPMSVVLEEHSALFAVGGKLSARPLAAPIFFGAPANLAVIRTAFDQLARFAEGDILARAIDRLGRSRLAVHQVDRALDLGMAAEIVLMHDQSVSNTEITQKIGTRAAWLLGKNADDRVQIFRQIKQLYAARSTAVHSGSLGSNSKVDLDDADALVARVILAILQRGTFPDWTRLTLGGG
jgi:Apea-like HEPN